MDNLTILIPHLNTSASLERTLLSVAKSSLHWASVCVIDLGSSVNEIEQLKKIRNCFSSKSLNVSLYFEKLASFSSARSFGYKKTESEFVLDLFCGDEVSEKYLENAISLLADHPTYAIVFPENENRLNVWHAINNKRYIFSCEDFLFIPPYSAGGVYRRSLIRRENPYDGMLTLGVELTDLYIHILSSDGLKAAVCSGFLFHHHDHVEQFAQNPEITAQAIQNQYIVYQNNKDVYRRFAASFVRQRLKLELLCSDLSRGLQIDPDGYDA